MIVTGWSNSGSGYGLKISIQDRDKYFDREMKFIILTLKELKKDVKINIDKDSFWNSTCRELIKKEIGQWLREIGKDTWGKGKPPKFEMKHISDNKFLISDN